MLLRAAARGLGLAEALAGCIAEWCDSDRVVHGSSAMLHLPHVRDRLWYEDADDCEKLHADPLFKHAVSGTQEIDRDVCFQATKR